MRKVQITIRDTTQAIHSEIVECDDDTAIEVTVFIQEADLAARGIVETRLSASEMNFDKVKIPGEIPFEYINYYECPECGHKWSDIYECQVDDDCPQCGNRHISPHWYDGVSYNKISLKPNIK